MYAYFNSSIRLVYSVFVLIIFCIACSTNIPKETIEVSPSLIHFLAKGDSAFTKTVYIKNNSQKNVNIIDISTSCGCTVAQIIDSVVHPKDSIPICIKYKPNKNDTNNVVRFVSIRTNGTPPIKSIEINVDFKHK